MITRFRRTAEIITAFLRGTWGVSKKISHILQKASRRSRSVASVGVGQQFFASICAQKTVQYFQSTVCLFKEMYEAYTHDC